MTHGCRPEIALSAPLNLAEGPGYLGLAASLRVRAGTAGGASRGILTPEFPRGSPAGCPQGLHRQPQVSHRPMCECLHKQTQYEGSTGSAAKRPPDYSRGRETPHEQDQHHSREPGSDRNGDELICLKPVGPNGNAVVIDNKVADEQLLLIAE
jgi:hypothetical protein